MMKKIALTLLATASLTAGANAQMLAGYDVSGSGTTATGPSPAVTGVGISATALARGTGLTFVSTTNAFNSNNWNISSTLDTTTTTGKYIYFDVTSTVATVFSTLQFAINGSNTAPNQGQWAYTLDGGTTFTLGTTANGGAFTTANAQPTAQSTWDFTDFTLTAGSTVEFRFFEYGATAINSGSTVSAGGTTRLANITGVGNPQYDLYLQGPIAVAQPVNAAAPEPSTWAMMAGGVGLLGLVIYRRNRLA